MFSSLKLPGAELRWRLDVQAGPHADILVAALIGADVSVECIAAGTAYRLKGRTALLEELAAKLAPIEGATLAHEPAPADSISLSSAVAPAHTYRRSVVIHGRGVYASGWVVRAVERRLAVQTVGVNRWAVSGRTSELVDWLAQVWVKTAEEVLQELGITAEQAAAEDAPTLPAPVVNVNLPDRRIESEITRDHTGGITKIVQTERTPA